MDNRSAVHGDGGCLDCRQARERRRADKDGRPGSSGPVILRVVGGRASRDAYPEEREDNVTTRMRALEFVAPGEVRWRATPMPLINAGHQAVVQPVAATTCDLDRAVITGMTPFTGPFDLGHECVARIIELGSDMPGLAVGDLVSVPWHVSCGACARCEADLPTQCLVTPPQAMFGLPLGGDYGGMFSERLLVPYAGANLRKLPAGVPAAAAAAVSDSLTDAYHAVLVGLRKWPGTAVLICGGLTHGLYATAVAAALGAAHITYVDDDERRRTLAASYGATVLSDTRDLRDAQFPVTVDAAAKPDGLRSALRATAAGGHCHSVGIYFTDVKLPLFSMYMNGVTLTTGRPEVSPYAAAVLDLLADGSLDPARVFDTTMAFDDLPNGLIQLPAKPLITFP